MTTNEPPPAGYHSGGYIGPESSAPDTFIPVPVGMTQAEALDALADAGTWVRVGHRVHIPDGARMRQEWIWGGGVEGTRYVYRDDLPSEPESEPDAELIERMCEAMWGPHPWAMLAESSRATYRERTSKGLAAVREHDTKGQS